MVGISAWDNFLGKSQPGPSYFMGAEGWDEELVAFGTWNMSLGGSAFSVENGIPHYGIKFQANGRETTSLPR
jgi:hypothetical protein